LAYLVQRPELFLAPIGPAADAAAPVRARSSLAERTRCERKNQSGFFNTQVLT